MIIHLNLLAPELRECTITKRYRTRIELNCKMNRKIKISKVWISDQTLIQIPKDWSRIHRRISQIGQWNIISISIKEQIRIQTRSSLKSSKRNALSNPLFCQILTRMHLFTLIKMAGGIIPGHQLQLPENKLRVIKGSFPTRSKPLQRCRARDQPE